MSIIIYGAETWQWTKADISRLTAAEMEFLSSMYRRKKTE
jgi:hypothetical protein